MTKYCLMDGAMAHHVLSESKPFNDPSTPWLAPLFPVDVLRVAGPLLIDYTKLVQGSVEQREFGRALDAFPHRLHVSVLQSDLSLEELAAHLRKFAGFVDSYGDTYYLRIADARVLAYLPSVLSAQQWNDLVGPLAKWQTTDRKGEVVLLPVPDTKAEAPDGDATVLHLDDEQIEKLAQAGEPDALLKLAGVSPRIEHAGLIQMHYQAACACLNHWKSTGNSSRATLEHFARLVFEQGPARCKDHAWIQAKFEQATTTTA